MRHFLWQKLLHKEIMRQSRLRNKYLKSKYLAGRESHNISQFRRKRIMQKSYFANIVSDVQIVAETLS